MSTARKATVILLSLTLLLIGACAQHHYEGAAAGGAVGGMAGAFLDDDNPWRGGVIGAALGAIFGATIADVSVRGAQEAAQTGRPVEYRTENGRGVYRADPLEYSPRTKCHKVQERTWQDGKIVKDEIKEVCESEKIERRY
jgi:outer membrane lipoprotein SlyB